MKLSKYFIPIIIFLPLIEMYVLVKLGSTIGIWQTIAIVVGTGVIGAYLAKQQGMKALHRFMTDFQLGKMSSQQIWDGVMLLFAALFLIIPGVLTDLIGLSFFIPPLRRFYQSRLEKIDWQSMLFRKKTYSAQNQQQENTNIQGRIIDL